MHRENSSVAETTRSLGLHNSGGIAEFQLGLDFRLVLAAENLEEEQKKTT